MQLGVTRIGDLLLENRFTQMGEGEVPEGIQLKIPIYQRPYKWTAKNAIQLLDDIIEAKNANKEVYRLGTLDLPKYKNGVGNRIARKLFDLAALLYVDRFCPDRPSRLDLDIFEQFVVMDFIWVYSLMKVSK